MGASVKTGAASDQGDTYVAELVNGPCPLNTGCLPSIRTTTRPSANESTRLTDRRERSYVEHLETSRSGSGGSLTTYDSKKISKSILAAPEETNKPNKATRQYPKRRIVYEETDVTCRSSEENANRQTDSRNDRRPHRAKKKRPRDHRYPRHTSPKKRQEVDIQYTAKECTAAARDAYQIAQSPRRQNISAGSLPAPAITNAGCFDQCAKRTMRR